MKSRQTGFTQDTSSAKADISVRTGRRIEKGEKSVIKERHWRTRTDPLTAVWNTQTHMNMITHRMSLNQLYSKLTTKIFQYPSYILA